MSSRLCSLLAAAVLAAPAAAAPVPGGAKYEPPTAVGRAASGQQILNEIKAFASAVEPKAADHLDKEIADLLGEKGFTGLDMKKPVGAFAYIKPKLEHSYAVFVFPVTTEKEALDLLERMQFGIEEEKGQKGLYRLKNRVILPEDTALRLKFHDGHAYVGLNADPDELAPAKLIPMKDLGDDAEKAAVWAKLFLGRCPAELREAAEGILAQAKRPLAQLEVQAPRDMPKTFPAFAKGCVEWAERNTAAGFADGEALTFRLTADGKTGQYATELSLTPKEGTKLAADIAAVKPSAGRFHQLTTKDAVGGLWLANPDLPKALREKAGPFLAEWLSMLEKDTDEPFKAVVGELAKAVEAGVTKGELDAGLAVLGPNKDGLYTAVSGLAVGDPAAIEKAVREAVKGLPKEVQGMVKLDAEKAGDLSVHVVTLPGVPEWAEKVIGKKAEVRVAFGGGAVFAAVGPDGLEQIKRAAALKRADGKSFDVTLNAAKVNKLLSEQVPAEGMRYIDMMLGKADGLRSQFGVEVSGGKALTVRLTQYRMGLFVGWMGFRF